MRSSGTNRNKASSVQDLKVTMQALGWPAGTVKSTLSRALRRLQALLAVEVLGAAEVTRD